MKEALGVRLSTLFALATCMLLQKIKPGSGIDLTCLVNDRNFVDLKNRGKTFSMKASLSDTRNIRPWEDQLTMCDIPAVRAQSSISCSLTGKMVSVSGKGTIGHFDSDSFPIGMDTQVGSSSMLRREKWPTIGGEE